ncbi:MAG: tetratricopeptide repeat protein, partial [Candidatus Poribacteria bacterium]|nr:tetratricopeptide repeat protein [Candidatus Poribacteria bacterium]
PKVAQKTFQALLTQRLLTTQLVEAQLGLAECHILLKRYTLAREVLEPIANRTNRFQATARKLIGDSYFFSADFDQAIKEYNEVIRIAKSDQLTNDALERIVLIQNHSDYLKIPLTDYAMAVQLYLSGQTEDALQQCERTLEVYPQATIVDDVWFLIGNIYREESKDPEAVNAYQQVVAQESLIAAKALVNIAEIYRQKADLDNAAETYTTLITNYPENVIVVYARQQLNEIMKLQQKE